MFVKSNSDLFFTRADKGNITLSVIFILAWGQLSF